MRVILTFLRYQGQSHEDKLSAVRSELTKAKARAFIVTSLDEVAWLFNLRGSDVDYNPGERLYMTPIFTRS
jgi:Xaa-Pro aminopeptidase